MDTTGDTRHAHAESRYTPRQRDPDPAPGQVQIRIIGKAADVDAAMALPGFAAPGRWQLASLTLSQNPPADRALGLLDVTPQSEPR